MADENRRERILIVDDEAQNITVLNEILKSEYDLYAAKDGEKALEISRSIKTPDLILLDIMMPKIDGYQVLKALKADEATRNIPVVLVSGKDEIDDKMTGYELGAVNYVTKPIDPDFIKEVVRTLLDRT